VASGQGRRTQARVHRAPSEQRAAGYLRAAGLSEAEIDAIATVGLGTDELHDLLLRGITQAADGTGA
jgi:hypothetical protein